ncbi:hypothetical protein AcW1_009141 [Taiwanofungus camphoratus]|nr:hypothetical protein AcV5_007164 [Antrodia cinnamomea]KAI0949571.1 hypothetical protein AcW1_009141 [Antrodia cinnamomea]
MESKKRPHAEDAEQSQPKKRAVSDVRYSPSHINGGMSQDDEPKDDNNLEMFRKDAIYRRMKYYAREHERSEARVAELERRRSTCEAGLAALEACWTQIIETIRLLVKPEDLPPVDVETQALFDLTAHVSVESDPEYIEALRDKMHATSELVSAFVRLGGQNQASPTGDVIFQKCQEAQTERSSLRSELSLTKLKLRVLESERDKYHEDLLAAEKRLDRMQSNTLATMQRQPMKVETKEESPVSTPASPVPSQPVINGTHSTEDEWREIAKVRVERINEYVRENTELREEIQKMKLELRSPSEEFITQSPFYKILQDRASKLEHATTESQNEVTRLKEELEQLELSRQGFQDAVALASDQEVQELKIMLNKRDSENSRLREQRDQQLSELNERKQKEHVKLQSLHEHKLLAESRSERIKVLESQLTRLKTRLAASTGDEDLMSFLFRDHTEELATYVEDLQKRLIAAENRAIALENSLSHFQEEHPNIVQHMKAESEARESLLEAKKQLEKYRSVYGDSSSAFPPDMQNLSEQLQRKEEEIQKFRLQEKQHEQAEAALYSELDRLSAAWESLDRQVKSKVFDLSAMEERLTKSGLDRAKSENKFYSAMRDKEAIENERKNISRNLEKQAKVVERLVETEKNLTARVHDLEKEVYAWKKAVCVEKERVVSLEEDGKEWKNRAEGERKRFEDARSVLIDHERSLERRREELRKMEEASARSKKEAERHVLKMKSTAQNHTTSSSTREAQLQSEVDKCMSILKCSTCKMNMRNTVITKCMHSFCKSCVDSRISTRQRKCPACNLPFSQGEVQQLFFQ